MDAMAKALCDELGDEFDLAFARFRELIDADRLDALQPLGPQAVYTTAITVWLLIYQRLNAGGSLLDAVHELLHTDAALLPDNRRVRERTLSNNTGAYGRARQRLKCEVTDAVAEHLFNSLVASFPPSLAGRRAFLWDGTTIALAPTTALRQAFPPASNQHGESTWPIAHLLVAHELESGCALLPELGAKFGPPAQSETELAEALLRRLPERSIVIADRNFGVFSVAYAARRLEHDVLFRLTEQRFRALVREAKAIESDDSSRRSWSLHWRPSKGDRQAHPELPADACVAATLHEVRLSDASTLWLLTTGPCTTDQAVALYGRRQDVETDIRNVKVVLDMEHLPARSPTMLRKELAISIVAYNLVVQVRRLAAARAKVPPRRLSFTGVWSAVRIILLSPPRWTAAEWRQHFELALRAASQRKIPHRPGRSYPRQALAKRNKSTSGQTPATKKGVK
jgi:hypothetical protein